MATATIELELSDGEATADGILSELPEDLDGVTVAVDCGGSALVTRSFTDQLGRELLEVRHASGLVLRGLSEAMTNAALKSSYLRGLPGLTVISG